ncbi:MAG: glutathione S-transferase family protein [Gemmatimonadota bacterium]|nr:glutathione S-transferase family protein [Gemmatimonadota bacterium]
MSQKAPERAGGTSRRLLEFYRSPSAVKVRVALNYKDLEYRTEEMMAADREPMVEAAGWPMVPILIDGEVVVRESSAILHYLEANYRDRPSLTPASREEIRSAEALLLFLRPEVLRIQWRLEPEVRKPDEERDMGRVKSSRIALTDALMRLEARLTGRDWLVGETMSIYDVILACDLLPSHPPAEFVEQSPMWAFFDEHFRLDAERARIANWIERVVAWDRPEGERPARDPA